MHLPTYLKHSVSKDPTFLKYMLAVIYVESGFETWAVSEVGAAGLMQVTNIAVKDTMNHCGLPHVTSDQLHNPATNIKYGTCYLNHMLNKMDGDWTKALIIYNGGYRQLTKYQKGETITLETSNYVLKVNRAFNICSKE